MLGNRPVTKSKNPDCCKQSGFSVSTPWDGKGEPVGKYKRIILRLTMKNGLELEAPVTKEIGIATAWVIKAAAVCLVLYGIAQLVSAVRWW